MMGNLFNKKQLVIISFIVIAVLIRLLPHLPNVTPVTAIALFSGAYFSNKNLFYYTNSNYVVI